MANTNLIPKSAEVRRRAQIFQMLGSFWTSTFKNSTQARTLMAAFLQNAAPSRMLATLAGLGSASGNAQMEEEARRVYHVAIPFTAEEVIPTGEQLYDDPDHPLTYSLSQGDSQRAYGVFRTPYFALALRGIIPIVIQADGRRLLCGTDFFIVRERWCLFRDDPRILFPKKSYMVTLGRRIERNSWLATVTGASGAETDEYLVAFLKRFPTPEYFRLALASVGGLTILRTGGRLVHKVNLFDRWIYTFESEVVRVDYPHTELEVGKAYPARYIVGEGVQVFQAEQRPSAWWRKINWRKGLSLRPLLPQFGELNLLDQETTAYVAGQDRGSVNGSRVHARIQLSDEYEKEAPYWEAVAARETKTGKYLNDMLGLLEEQEDPQAHANLAQLIADNAEANELNRKMKWPLEAPDLASLDRTVQVNALDAFFVAVLDRCAYVLLIDYHTLNPKYVPAFFSFLGRELPTGGTPIVFIRGPRLRQRSRLQGTTPPTTTVFYSFARDQLVDCPGDTIGTSRLVELPLGAFTSEVSQADADAQAILRLQELVLIAQSELVCDTPCESISVDNVVGCQPFSETLSVTNPTPV